MFASGFVVTDTYQDGDIHNIQGFKRSVLVHVVNPSSSLTLYYRIYGSLDKENWVSEVSEQTLAGSASGAHEITKPWAYLKAQAKISAWGPLTECWSHTDEGDTWIDETTDANDAGTNDVKLPPHSNYPSDRKDWIYYGLSSQFTALKITVGVAKSYTDNPTGIGWEYWNGEAWTRLSDVDDETDGSRQAGADLEVNYTLPSDWATKVVNTSDAMYWIRFGGYGANSSSAPLATQIWVAVASSTILALINGR